MNNLTKIDLHRPVEEILKSDLDGLWSGELGVSSIPGGQTAADAALAQLDIKGYAEFRSEVLPRENRGASVLSPYIRHNFLTLKQVYEAVADAPFRDREKFRDELFWQEYARHLYARIGVQLFENLRFDVNWNSEGQGWNREMLCIDAMASELENDGWLVNQSRMWLASHWTVRNDKGWIHGQEEMYRNLLDGSRAANLLGWQWTVGAGTGKPYGFAKWQVDKRAPGLCTKCSLRSSCPIENFPDEISPPQLPKNPLLDSDADVATTIGPREVIKNRKANFVLLTIDSMGDADPALASNPDLPVVFIFNEAALIKLQLSSRRIGFYLQSLQDLSQRREVQIYLGDPYDFVKKNDVAITYAPVPSFRKFSTLAEIHPYPWLKEPHAGTVRSFTSWRQKIDKSYKR